MNVLSEKQTHQQVRDKNHPSDNDRANLPKKKTSRFSGMAEKAVMLTPVIIPGYKIRG